MGKTTPPEPRTLDELLRQRARDVPDLPIAAFPTSAEPDSYRAHSAAELDAYATRAAHHYQGVFGHRTQNAPERSMAGQLVEFLAGKNPTRGGSSETDENEPIVMP